MATLEAPAPTVGWQDTGEVEELVAHIYPPNTKGTPGSAGYCGVPYEKDPHAQMHGIVKWLGPGSACSQCGTATCTRCEEIVKVEWGLA